MDATLDELKIDTLPPLRSSLTPTEDTRGVPFEPELQIAFGELIQKGAGTILLKLAADGSPVETIDVASAAVSVSGTTATIQPASTLLDSTAYRVEVAAGAFTDRAGNEAAAIDGATEWTFTTRGALVVESFQATGTGFVATFTSDLRSDALNLYDQGGVWGPADVRVVGAATGLVQGSLVVGPGLRQVTFVATSGILPPDQYSVTFVSGTDGLHDVNAKQPVEGRNHYRRRRRKHRLAGSLLRRCRDRAGAAGRLAQRAGRCDCIYHASGGSKTS